MENATWPAEWLRSALTAAVLPIVSEEETYGYLVAQRLKAGGLGVVKGGTLIHSLADWNRMAMWSRRGGKA